MRDTIANPDAAIAALMKREPLLNKDLEKRRLHVHPEDRDARHPKSPPSAWATCSDARFARSLIQVQEAFELPRVPTAAEVFDRRFLPPLAERRVAAP